MKKNVFLFLALMLLFSIKGFATDYTFTSHADIQAFVNSVPQLTQYAADNLYITGSDVTQGDIDALQGCFSSVNVGFTFENVTLYVPSTGAAATDGVKNLDGFLKNVTQNGSIVIRNCPYTSWIGQGCLPDEIHGDLILDNIPIPYPGVDNWATNTSFGDIKKVDGDFIINATGGLQKFGPACFQNLDTVGGSFRILVSGSNSTWNMPAPKLTYIGGDFEINAIEYNDDGTPFNFQLWALDILESIQYIGGDVTVLNCPRMQIGWGSDNHDITSTGFQEGTGYCYIRYLIDTGVIDYFNCKNVTLGMSDNLLDLSTFGACMFSDCDNQDPASTPDRSPDCPTGIPTVKAASAFATVQPAYVKDDLTVTSTANLAKVDVIAITGQTVKSFTTFTSGQNSLPVSNLANGIYLVRLVSVNNEAQTVKIIKQ